MKEIFSMWKNTRMVVLTALSAAVYAAVLIPFKPLPIIPGFTEIRPANVLPIVCSLMFGPAGAWGAAFGNLIGDFFGTLGPGSIFGFIGNFLYGFIPYKLWRVSRGISVLGSARGLLKYLSIALLSSVVCGVVIGWGIDLLGLVPFSALGNIIAVNNFIVAAILGPLLLGVLYPRIERWGLLYTDIMEENDISKPRYPTLGRILLWSGAIGGLGFGNLISVGIYRSGLFGAGFAQGIAGEVGVGIGLLPFIGLILISAVFL